MFKKILLIFALVCGNSFGLDRFPALDAVKSCLILTNITNAKIDNEIIITSKSGQENFRISLYAKQALIVSNLSGDSEIYLEADIPDGIHYVSGSYLFANLEGEGMVNVGNVSKRSLREKLESISTPILIMQKEILRIKIKSISK